MKPEDYDKEKELLEKEYIDAKRALAVKYAFANNPYNKGDIIQDHSCIIQITNIQATHSLNKYPECVYTGVELKKDLTPKKNGNIEQIWQCNVKAKLN